MLLGYDCLATDTGKKAVHRRFLGELRGVQVGAGAVHKERVVAGPESEGPLQIDQAKEDRPKTMTAAAIVSEA